MAVDTAAAVIGLSALVRSSATGYELIRITGGDYLLWPAVSALRGGEQGRTPVAGPPDQVRGSSASVARQAVLTKLLNPRIIVVDADRRRVALQLLFLGLAFAMVGLVVGAVIGVFAGRVGRRLSQSHRVRALLDRIAPTVDVALAARLLTDRS